MMGTPNPPARPTLRARLAESGRGSCHDLPTDPQVGAVAAPRQAAGCRREGTVTGW